MDNFILDRSYTNVDITLNNKRIYLILDELIRIKQHKTSRSQVSEENLFKLIKKILTIKKLNDNRFLLWTYIYILLKRMENKTPKELEKEIFKGLIKRISDILGINDVFHKSVIKLYEFITKDENENEFKFIILLLEQIESNNIYIEHIDILVEEFKLINPPETEKSFGDNLRKKNTKKGEPKKDYISFLQPIFKSMYIQVSKWDNTNIEYKDKLSEYFEEVKQYLENLKKKSTSGVIKPNQRGLK